MQNYGNLILSDKPRLNPEETEWISTLLSRYPRIIVDDKEPPSRELYFITLENLGIISLDKKGNITEATPRNVVVQRIKENLEIWSSRVELAILKACSSTLIFSPTVKYYLNPLRRIIATLLLSGNITKKEIGWLPNEERALQWIFLLKTAKFVEEYQEGYKYGDLWAEFIKKSNKIIVDPEDEYHPIFKENLQSFNRNSVFEHLVMSYMLEENFSYIQDVMNLHHMNTVINMNNAFYKPCLISGKLLSMKPKTVLNYYNKFYPEQKFVQVSSTIMDLVSIGLLNLQEGKLHGNDNRFQKMLEYRPPKQVALPL
jgi:hypothetical protein